MNTKNQTMTELSEIMVTKQGSVDPSKAPNESFDLLSIPAYDQGEPQVIQGCEIGSTKKRVQPNDVLLSRIVPHIRRAWVVPPIRSRRQIASSEWIVFRSDKIWPSYLRHVLMADEFHHQFMNTVAGVGGSLMRARPEFVKRIKIYLPKLAKQRRIAAILDKADAIRRKRCRAIELTDQFLKSAFLEMFGDPVTNPKGYETKQLSEISDIQGGLQVTSKREGLPIKLPYLRVANVHRESLDLEIIKPMQVTPQEFARVKLVCGDILVVEGHGNRDEIGRCAVWDASIDPCIHQNHLIRIRLNPECAYPTYVSAYLNSAGGRRQLFRRSNTTSGLNTISTTTLKSTTVLLPEKSAQQRYLDLVAKVNQLRSAQRIIHASGDAFFNSLVQRAFRGELTG